MSAAPAATSYASARLKIAQVATTAVSIQLLLSEHIHALAQQGHDVTAISSPGEHLDAVRQMGIQVIEIPMARELNPLADIGSLQSLTECFREQNFDVVHSHTPKAGLLAPLAAGMAKVPVIVHTVHGLLFHDRQNFFQRCLYWLPEKLTASACHHLLSQSEEDVQVALATHLCSPEKISYLGNGIDVEHFAPLSLAARAEMRAALGIAPDEFVFGAVGRLVHEKGFEDFFAAAETIKQRHLRARFLVIGNEEADQHDAIPAHRLRDLRMRGVVQFLGWQQDMPRCYAAMDAYVLPSLREGIPRACMEAAACGLPVIASDIRGCREVVRHGDTGLLVEANNPASLAKAMSSLMADAEAAHRMGENGRQHIMRHFDQRQVLARLCVYYEQISSTLEMRRHGKKSLQ